MPTLPEYHFFTTTGSTSATKAASTEEEVSPLFDKEGRKRPPGVRLKEYQDAHANLNYRYKVLRSEYDFVVKMLKESEDKLRDSIPKSKMLQRVSKLSKEFGFGIDDRRTPADQLEEFFSCVYTRMKDEVTDELAE